MANSPQMEKIKSALRLSKEQLEAIWQNNADPTAIVTKPDGSNLTVYKTRTLGKSFVLYAGPTTVQNRDGNSSLDGLGWQWQYNDAWFGRYFEAPYEWFAENGPPVANVLNHISAVARSTAIADSPGDKPDTLSPEKRRSQLDARAILDPVFEKTEKKVIAPKLRKNIHSATSQHNPGRMTRVAENTRDKIVKKESNKKVLAIPLFIAALGYAGYIGYTQIFAQMNLEADFKAQADRVSNKITSLLSANPEMTGNDCINYAFQDVEPLCANDDVACHSTNTVQFMTYCLSSLAAKLNKAGDEDVFVKRMFPPCEMTGEEFRKTYCDVSPRNLKICDAPGSFMRVDAVRDGVIVTPISEGFHPDVCYRKADEK